MSWKRSPLLLTLAAMGGLGCARSMHLPHGHDGYAAYRVVEPFGVSEGPSSSQPGETATSAAKGQRSFEEGDQSVAAAPQPAPEIEPERRDESAPLQAGDVIEIIFSTDLAAEGEYKILPGDLIRVEFLHLRKDEVEADPLEDRSALVQPDGNLAMPYIGMVNARGMTIEQLNAELNRRYEEFYVEPRVHASLERVSKQLQSLTKGESKCRTVRIDSGGAVVAPLIGSVPAAGMTVNELQQELQARYRRLVPNLVATTRWINPDDSSVSTAPSLP